MRIILYTGKGGVGKTSLSAATAVRCAQLGYRTIVLSTDAAHSLADCLDTTLGPEPTEVAPNCWAEEVNVNYELHANWSNIQDYITKFLRNRGFREIEAEEFAVFPGMEELFSLLKLKQHRQEANFDVAIIDCAPTGATIRMLGMPDVMRWYMERFFELERRIMRTMRPAFEKIAKVPLPTDDVYQAVEGVFDRIQGMKDLLTDSRHASIRLVFNPERMVIRESQRAYSYLSLFGFTVDAVIANRLIPPTVQDDYFAQWKRIQRKHMQTAKEIFDPLPIFEGALYDTEVVGLAALERMAEDIFGDHDPAAVYHDVPPIRLTPTNGDTGGYDMIVHLPGVDKSELNLTVVGSELVADLNNCRRNILLPRLLAECELTSAKFEDDYLRIHFERR